MLWLALRFPTLPLDLWSRSAATPTPLAVSEGTARPRIAACNLDASLAGIRPGMALAAAWAVLPGLVVRPRDAAAETRALEQLAGWAGRYTPEVSLQTPDGLLLQLAQSLNLFGGLDALLREVRNDLAALGYFAVAATAPTPHGAWLLARAGQESTPTTAAELAASLRTLPAALLEQPAAVLNLLEKIGATTLGDCRALPRDGLARRAGPGLLDELDRAFGDKADPRPYYAPPSRYAARLELPFEAEYAEALLFAARRLLTELAGFLESRCAGVRRLRLGLSHRDGDPTELVWGLIAPSRDLNHLTGLLQERLGQLELAAPVQAIALETLELQTMASANRPLFDGGPTEEGRWQLIERLRERLGRHAVAGLAPHADHRPERAWRTKEPSIPSPTKGAGEIKDSGPGLSTRNPLLVAGAAPTGATPRPAWLLPAPQALTQTAGRPHWQGPLALLAGPERIEAGWWDEAPAARDYYLAQTPAGSRVWVYREGDDWFLHGLFA
ncbi:Y-family DNA polymerase [Methylogaea oryzae]|uniref:DNA polymerase n=1 Tax=Methylogaea oryzae TaxID=1295382 RepID=A0A8D4VQ94_9GAMM|nr:DNA polymerase Y family protein [Methylogaea oryzae]BBL71781.1 DNA polymerase [Methylogaea oryzae]